MKFAWYLKRFGLEYLVCTVPAASWSQHLYYAGDYLQHFVLFAACCLELVFGSIGPEDQGTRGPRDQGTRGPEDQGTRGPGDQRTRGPEDHGDQRIRGTLNKLFFQ